MSVNACYGGTAALFNSIAWMESNSWDGRSAIVIMTDVAVYPEGSARATGGAGSIAILITPNAPITFEPIRASHMTNTYDFYKPYPMKEYPEVDGLLSVDTYFNCLGECYQNLKEKYQRFMREKLIIPHFDQLIFHSPFNKQVKKSFGKLLFDDL
jgi:hydroxymethylglutaryl-CoA synthase